MGMGYQGFARFYLTSPGGVPPTDPLLFLCTSSSVNIVLEPIYSSAVWGAGWYNAPTSAHYADSAIRYEGSIEFELQATEDIWNFVRDWAIEQRAWPRSLEISPDGQSLYEYWVGAFATPNDPTTLFTPGVYGPGIGATFNNCGAWVSSLSFNTSQGSFVSSSLNMVSIFRKILTTADDANLKKYIDQRTGYIAMNPTANGFVGTNPLNPSQTNLNPIPFWKTDARLYDVSGARPYSPDTAWGGGGTPLPWQTGTEATDWSIEVANNHTVLYTCSGTRYPTAVLMGAIDGTGNVTLYNNDGVYDPVFPPAGVTARTAENTAFRVIITTGVGTYAYIDMPAAFVESDDFGIKGQSEVTTRAYTLKGLGGRVVTPTAGPYIGAETLFPPIYMSLIV